MLGRLLFRWRAHVGGAAFVLVLALGKPTFGTWLTGLPLALLGLALRAWATGYIGAEARAQELGGTRVVHGGPYRRFRHPLYLGNFLLVAGTLLAYRPAVWLWLVVGAGFLVGYGLMARAEEQHLAAAVRVERRFSWPRLAAERWTWLVVLAVFGLALLRAALR